MPLQKSIIIVAGAVGVALILAAVLISSPGLATKREQSVRVTIEGLKETYMVGEPIDFFVNVQGYGCDAGFPTVAIIVMKQGSNLTLGGEGGEPVWSRMGEIRSFPFGVSCEPADLHKVRHIGGLQKYNSDDQERIRTTGGVPIIIQNEGRYAVVVGGAGAAVTKEFSVVATGAS